ncbi:hypothetical protein [Aidingimonas lacisalsi]|uniref:hypothetical protein n=1 Tax=Aidingimonas lacisalsi TaxID=2604086 RepID=UPI0011D1BBF7|nr:hypothetical protein [Aidingimonas lacisalsi]
MKINVEFDLTPAEFRQAMGLPDVEGFQQELMSRIQKQMDAGVEGYDPMSLMEPFLKQPYFKEGMANLGSYQQMMFDMLRQAGSASSRQSATSASHDTQTADDQNSSRTGPETAGEGDESTTRSSTKGSASATSRGKRR